MKCIVLILLTSMVISCGKKSDSDDEKKVTTTPPITVEDEPENIIEGESFSITSNKEVYTEGEAILLRVKNLGKTNLDHLAFKFGSEPSSSVVSNLNCFQEIAPEAECLFSVVIENPKVKHQKISIRYDELGTDIELQLNLQIIVDEDNPEIKFLYRKEHTFADCSKLFKLQDYGEVTSILYNNYCKVRAKDWGAEKKVEITVDPMSEYHDEIVDNNKHYCGADWTLHSLQFEAAEVTEIKNIFGGKRTVEIPPGESREVCVKRNLFGCKTKKVFYSRLVAANCY